VTSRTVLVVVGFVGTGVLVAGGLVAEHRGAADRSQIAAAKCALPVIERLGYDAESPLYPSAIDVTALGKGSYRVYGRVADHSRGRAYSYVCEVVPDSSDRLRGFRVSRLDVEPV
jgi:hypothetical protein